VGNIQGTLREIVGRIQSKLGGTSARAHMSAAKTEVADEFRAWTDLQDLLEAAPDRFARKALPTLLGRAGDSAETSRLQTLAADPLRLRAELLIDLCGSEEAGCRQLWPVAAFLSRMLHALRPEWTPRSLEHLEGEDFVRALYRTILGAPAGDVLPLWLELLDRGYMTKQEMTTVFLEIAGGAQQRSDSLT